MDTFYAIISALLIFFVITDVSAAYLLLRGAVDTHYSLVALNERAVVATLQASSAAILGLLGANRLFGWHWTPEIALVMLVAALLLQAIPSIVWLLLYFKHKFGGGIQ